MDLQFNAPPVFTLVTGTSGSGKTTFLLHNLRADTALQCRFLFDPEGEYAAKLQLPAAETREELLFSVEDGFCIFDPHTLFPGDLQAAFEFFCEFTFAAAEQLPGRKVLVVDEAWKYCTPNAIPKPLQKCVQTGRKRGLEQMFATQQPNKLNGTIRNETTELVTFHLQDKNALAIVEEFSVNPSEVSRLIPGQFISRLLKTGREIRGEMWPKVRKTGVAPCLKVPRSTTVLKPARRIPA